MFINIKKKVEHYAKVLGHKSIFIRALLGHQNPSPNYYCSVYTVMYYQP